VGSSDAPVSGQRTRVLFVPTKLLAPELDLIFQDRGSLELQSAVGYRDALAVASWWKPDLIVLSSEIDGEDALDFCQTVRSQTRASPPRLLMITEHLDGELDIDVPSDAHLVSPVAVEQLLATIAELTGVNQRGLPRVPLEVLVHTEGFADEGATSDTTLSTGIALSEDCMMLEASRQLGVGARGRLQFFLPAVDERLSVEAHVRVAIDEIRLLYVLEFLGLAPHHRALVRRYMESQKAAA
jgi:CheY-like chemotaxis protein